MRKLTLLTFTAFGLATGAAVAGPVFECDLVNTVDSTDVVHTTRVVTVAPKPLGAGVPADRWGQGMVIGNNGTADVSVMRTGQGLSFTEITMEGTIQHLVVAIDYAPPGNQPDELPMTSAFDAPVKFPALYSRHTIGNKWTDGPDRKIVPYFPPQQYMGECTLTN